MPFDYERSQVLESLDDHPDGKGKIIVRGFGGLTVETTIDNLRLLYHPDREDTGCVVDQDPVEPGIVYVATGDLHRLANAFTWLTNIPKKKRA